MDDSGFALRRPLVFNNPHFLSSVKRVGGSLVGYASQMFPRSFLLIEGHIEFIRSQRIAAT
jgi:hypothetical protein